jgi:flagellar motor switch protein FliN/FliY
VSVNPKENITRYVGLKLPLEPELGRCVMSVREIIELAPGSVIKLPRPIGAKVDIHVGGALFGTGELVSLGGALALRFCGFPATEPGGPE